LVSNKASEIESWLKRCVGSASIFREFQEERRGRWTNGKTARKVVAFDFEWQPDSHRNSRNPVAVVALACYTRQPKTNYTITNILIAQILPEPKSRELIEALFERKDIIMVGIGLKQDTEKFPKCESGRDLADYAEECKIFPPNGGKHGVASLCEMLLLRHCPKDKGVTVSDWSRDELSDDQVAYASLDVFVALEVQFCLPVLEE
jgi:hypothetical protein